MALEYEDWIKLAEERKLFLRIEDFEAMDVGTPYLVAEVDYLGFLASNDFERQDWDDPNVIKYDIVYTSEDLFRHVKDVIIPSGTNEVRGSITIHDFTLYRPDEGPIDYGFYTVEDNPRLFSGNGDSWSRWMLWSDVVQMPDLYIARPKGI